MQGPGGSGGGRRRLVVAAQRRRALASIMGRGASLTHSQGAARRGAEQQCGRGGGRAAAASTEIGWLWSHSTLECRGCYETRLASSSAKAPGMRFIITKGWRKGQPVAINDWKYAIETLSSGPHLRDACRGRRRGAVWRTARLPSYSTGCQWGAVGARRDAAGMARGRLKHVLNLPRARSGGSAPHGVQRGASPGGRKRTANTCKHIWCHSWPTMGTPCAAAK